MKHTSYAVYIEQDEDGVFIGSIPLIPSCYAQGDTEEEMLGNLQEVLRLCLRNVDQASLEKTKFVGIHNLEVVNA
jgi:predicted RNase H-like HicB family nuclease